MFLGYTGGVKAKIILNGTNVGSAWYVPPAPLVNTTTGYWTSTRPLQLSTTPGPATQIKPYLVESFQFPDNTLSTITFSPTYSVQTVNLERPNYSMGYAPLAMSAPSGGSDSNVIMMNNMEFEFEIPYMSPLRFVGDGTKQATVTSVELTAQFLKDLGNIVIKYGVPTGVLAGFQTSASASIEILVSATDESRFGYQVFAPAVSLNSYLASDGESYQLIPSTSELDTTRGLTPFSNLVGPSHNYTSMYYSAPP